VAAKETVSHKTQETAAPKTQETTILQDAVKLKDLSKVAPELFLV